MHVFLYQYTKICLLFSGCLLFRKFSNQSLISELFFFQFCTLTNNGKNFLYTSVWVSLSITFFTGDCLGKSVYIFILALVSDCPPKMFSKSMWDMGRLFLYPLRLCHWNLTDNRQINRRKKTIIHIHLELTKGVAPQMAKVGDYVPK